jgi:hypothetical protein
MIYILLGISYTMDIWDNLPDCVLDKIYSKITFPQPKKLLYDIESYILFMDFVNSGYVNINSILWNLILIDARIPDNKNKITEFNDIIVKDINIYNNYVLKCIKKYALKITPDMRYKIIRTFIFIE